jgi:fatty acid desaturase
VSFFDNLYHYGTPVDNSKTAKELLLPDTVSAMLLHGNYHETHHLNPDVPWARLPDRHRRDNRGFDGGLLAQGIAQFNGPIAQRWNFATCAR